MNDLISRQAALAEIDKSRDALLSSGMTGAEHILVHYGRRVIEEQPTIDPVKHGKWICVNGKYYCSECDEEQDWKTYYCSGCGAKMDGGEDERTD